MQALTTYHVDMQNYKHWCFITKKQNLTLKRQKIIREIDSICAVPCSRSWWNWQCSSENLHCIQENDKKREVDLRIRGNEKYDDFALLFPALLVY